MAKAVEALLAAGIEGPYGLALGPEAYTRVLETSEHGGYPLLEHLRQIAGGPLVWAPGVAGAVVVSLRGGDFLFESGEDISIGYDGPRRRRRAPVSGRKLHLPRGHAGGRCAALALVRLDNGPPIAHNRLPTQALRLQSIAAARAEGAEGVAW